MLCCTRCCASKRVQAGISRDTLHQWCQSHPGSPEILKSDLVLMRSSRFLEQTEGPTIIPARERLGLASLWVWPLHAAKWPFLALDGCLWNQQHILTGLDGSENFFCLTSFPLSTFLYNFSSYHLSMSNIPWGSAFGVLYLAPTKQQGKSVSIAAQCAPIHIKIRIYLEDVHTRQWE